MHHYALITRKKSIFWLKAKHKIASNSTVFVISRKGIVGCSQGWPSSATMTLIKISKLMIDQFLLILILSFVENQSQIRYGLRCSSLVAVCSYDNIVHWKLATYFQHQVTCESASDRFWGDGAACLINLCLNVSWSLHLNTSESSSWCNLFVFIPYSN